MIVLIATDGDHLLEPDDFKRFSVNLAEPKPAHPPARTGIVFESIEVAWVSVDHLIALRGPEATAAWRQALTAMISKAAAHGWVSPDGRQIRAHVVWDSPQRATQ
jgi:hypothetical protein